MLTGCGCGCDSPCHGVTGQTRVAASRVPWHAMGDEFNALHVSEKDTLFMTPPLQQRTTILPVDALKALDHVFLQPVNLC